MPNIKIMCRMWASYVASLAGPESIHSAALRYFCLELCIQATVCVGQNVSPQVLNV